MESPPITAFGVSKSNQQPAFILSCLDSIFNFFLKTGWFLLCSTLLQDSSADPRIWFSVLQGLKLHDKGGDWYSGIHCFNYHGQFFFSSFHLILPFRIRVACKNWILVRFCMLLFIFPFWMSFVIALANLAPENIESWLGYVELVLFCSENQMSRF